MGLGRCGPLCAGEFDPSLSPSPCPPWRGDAPTLALPEGESEGAAPKQEALFSVESFPGHISQSPHSGEGPECEVGEGEDAGKGKR